MDVTPLSLGVQVEGGVMSVIIPRNSPIPIKKEKRYTTTSDNQTTLSFPVYEGERKMTADNHKLGEFELSNISPEKARKAIIKVYFSVDSNGMFYLTAED